MKKILCFLSTAVLVAFASCSRNELVPSPEKGKMVVTMTSEATKTAVSIEGAPTWTAGDQLGVFVRKGADYVDQNISTTALASATADATFTAQVTSPEEACTYDFYTYYPYSDLADCAYDCVRVEIHAEQNPANDSFDPKADILTGYPIAREVEAGATTCEGLELQFLRKTAAIVFTPSSCEGFDGITADTYVTEVQVEMDQNIVGIANWDVRKMDDITLETGASNKVTVKYAAESHKLSDPIWISIAPVTEVGSLTFRIKVAENTYLCATKTLGNKLAFAANSLKKFDIPVKADSWELKTISEAYALVTEAPSDWKGQYLIVGKEGEKYYACDQSAVGSWGKCSEVTVTDGAIAIDDTTKGYEFTVVGGSSENKYSFKFTDGGYVSAGTNKEFNKIESYDADKADFSISVNSDKTANVVNGTSRILKYNYNGGNGGLRFYDSGSLSYPYLFKKGTVATDVRPIIGDKTIAQIAKEGVTDATVEISVSQLGKHSVSVSCDGTVVSAASVEYSAGAATVTYTVDANAGDEREGWIKLTAGSVEKQFTVSQASGVVAPEITAEDQEVSYEAGEGKTFDVTVTNVISAPTCTADGTVVTAAIISQKEGATYTVTYTVSANNTLAVRNGKITITCGSTSKEVKIAQGVNPNTKTYVQVTSLDKVTPGTYMIVAKTATYTGYLKYAASASVAPTYVKGLTITDGKIVVVDDSDRSWDFTGTSSEMTIKHGTDYLYGISNNNGIRIGSTADTWTIAVHADESTSFTMKNASNSRYCGVYNDADWRSYTAYDATNYTSNTGSSKIMLFKLDDGKQDSDIAFSASSKTLGLDDAVEGMPTVSKSNSGAVSYTSNKTTVATVDASTGAVTLVGVGETVITASVEADATYRAGSATYKLTVTAPNREFSVNATSIDAAAAGETGKTVTVTASDKVDWSMLVEEGITVTSCTATQVGDNNYKGSGVITFDVAANSGVARTLPIVLGTSTPYAAASELTVNVNQAGAVVAKTFTVSPLSFTSVAAAGETKEVTITADADVEWALSDVTSGLTFSIKSGDNADADGDYAYGTGSAVLNVIVPKNTGAAKEHSFKVGTDNASVSKNSYTVSLSQLSGTVADDSITLSSGSYSGSGTTGKIVWSGNNCSITQTKGSSSTNVSSSYVSAPRWYQSHVISFASSTATIKTVVVVCTSTTYATALKNSTYSTGASATVSSSTVTITASGDFTITMGAQSRISSITVKY